jgi:hypothetical protein
MLTGNGFSRAKQLSREPPMTWRHEKLFSLVNPCQCCVSANRGKKASKIFGRDIQLLIFATRI